MKPSPIRYRGSCPDRTLTEIDARFWELRMQWAWNHTPSEAAVSPCWRIKDVSTYDPQAYGPTPFSPRDSLGSYQSAEQEDYKRLIYFYSLATPTLFMVKLENDYTTTEND
jgi:hypothetical protein